MCVLLPVHSAKDAHIPWLWLWPGSHPSASFHWGAPRAALSPHTYTKMLCDPWFLGFSNSALGVVTPELSFPIHCCSNICYLFILSWTLQLPKLLSSSRLNLQHPWGSSSTIPLLVLQGREGENMHRQGPAQDRNTQVTVMSTDTNPGFLIYSLPVRTVISLKSPEICRLKWTLAQVASFWYNNLL